MPKRAEAIVPIVREEVEVARRTRPVDRARVRKHVVTEQKTVELTSSKENLDIERVPANRIAAELPTVRVEGDTTIIPVVEEIVVVEKRFVVKEEIRITKRREQSTRRVSIPVRREEATIEHELSSEELRRRTT